MEPNTATKPNDLEGLSRTKGGRLRRISSLVRKEVYQIVRDPSSMLIAFVLPLVLLFLFGYGVSLDLNNINVGVVVETPSTRAGSLLHSLKAAVTLLCVYPRPGPTWNRFSVGGRLNAVVVIPADFEERIEQGAVSPIQVLVRATEAQYR